MVSVVVRNTFYRNEQNQYYDQPLVAMLITNYTIYRDKMTAPGRKDDNLGTTYTNKEEEEESNWLVIKVLIFVSLSFCIYIIVTYTNPTTVVLHGWIEY